MGREAGYFCKQTSTKLMKSSDLKHGSHQKRLMQYSEWVKGNICEEHN